MRERVHQLLEQATLEVLHALDPTRRLEPDDVPLVPTKSREHGDFASSVALGLGRQLAMAPRTLAERIVSELAPAAELVERVEIAGPGFINFFLASSPWHRVVRQVLREGDRYGRSDLGRAERIQIEFVSANPTGPLTIGHGRNAVLGDCIAALLEAIGHPVTREYYFNDGGRQMRVLAQSLRARYLQALGQSAALPEEGYQGEYLVEIARALVEEVGSAWAGAEESRFQERATRAIFADIHATLGRLGVRFDVYQNEHALYQEGCVEGTLRDLRKSGRVYERDGAVWLRSTELGEDRDRVLVKSSGEPTYLLPDIAYHRQKLERGFARVIDVLGPDHIEQFPYVTSALAALGADPACIELVLYQWVNLRRGGEIVKMSTRKASFVTVDEVLDEVGADVFRYFMVDRRAETHLDFDLDLARERSDRNPVYKIQYAHARLASIERLAGERGVPPIASGDLEALPLDRLESVEEAELAKQLGAYPETIARAARSREPQELARYLLDLANAFNAYISDGRRHRVLSSDPELTRARLALAGAVRVTLANGLGLLGIQAPERM
jgi:arginyl-tRNA synthetase